MNKAKVKHMNNLRKLNLSFNKKITDEGIKHMNNLTTLNLNLNKNITNEGIKHMNNLKSLNLYWNLLIYIFYYLISIYLI